MRWCVIFLLFLAVPASAQGIAGVYTVEGLNPDDSQYRHTATVIETGDLVELTMVNEHGEVTAVAIGIREGAVVSAIFRTRDGVIGLASYALKDGKWIGRWHIPGTDLILPEVLTPEDPRLHGADPRPKQTL